MEFHDCFKAIMILPVQPSAWSHTDEQEQMDEASQKSITKLLQAVNEHACRQCRRITSLTLPFVDELTRSSALEEAIPVAVHPNSS